MRRRITWAVSVLTAQALAAWALVACGTVKQSGSGASIDAGENPALACATDGDCPTTSPVCDVDGKMCRGCSENAECGRQVNANVCDSGSGQCVACVTNDDCSLETLPICDQDEFQCRGCASNDECESGVCNRVTHQCAGADEVVWVDRSSSFTVGCTRDEPCNTIHAGLVVLATKNEPRYLVIVATTLPYDTGLATETIPGASYVDATDARFAATSGQVSVGFQVSSSSTGGLTSTGVVWLGGTFDGAPLSADPGAHKAFLLTSGELTVIGATFTREGTAIEATNGALTVFRSVFDHNQVAISPSDASELIVERSAFRDQTHESIGLFTGNATIRNNLFVNNGVPSSYARVINPAPPAGIEVNVLYNTFSGNRTDYTGVVSCSDVDGSTYVVGNIIWNTNGDSPLSSCLAANIFGNILEQPGNDYEAGNVLDDPLFVDADGGDFSLQPESPAVNAGDLLWAPATDLLGHSRTADDAPDVGAYELVP